MFRTIVLCCVMALPFVASQCRYSKSLAAKDKFEFFSPGYPRNYARNLNCQWTITAPAGYGMQIYCPDFVLPTSPNCTQDVVSFNEKKYCARGAVVAQTPSNILKVLLKTVTNTGKFFCEVTTQASPCTCGHKKSTKIVGGTETLVNEYPFQAYLKDSTGVVCSATIINDEYAMTAAHCLTGRAPGEMKLVVGDHDTSTEKDTNATVVHDISELIIHEQYSGNKNDIGLVRLAKKIVFNDNVGPVCLPFKFKGNLLENKPVTITGWGTLEFGGPKSKTLQKVDLETTSMDRCKADYAEADDTMLCTYADDKDSCQHDSGGSVYYTENDHVYSVGIVSGGAGCAGPKSGLNTRVSSQLDWIMKKTVGAQFCTQ